MRKSLQNRNKNFWVSLMARLTAKCTSVGGVCHRGRKDDIDHTPTIRIEVMPSGTEQNDVEAGTLGKPIDPERRDDSSTFLTNHLEYMFKVGASPTSVKTKHENHGCSRSLHKIAFIFTGSVSVIQGLFDVKYFALQISEDGSIRDVADLCYIGARVVLRGTIFFQLASGEKIQKLAQDLDSMAQFAMKNVSGMKRRFIRVAGAAFSFMSPALLNLVRFGQSNWCIHTFLDDQFVLLFYDTMVWSIAGESKAQNIIDELSSGAKFAGGLTSILSNSIALIHELLARQIMMTSTITLDCMANSFRAEFESAPPTPAAVDPDVRVLPKSVWEKYVTTKKASGAINKRFGVLFNVLHVLFLLQCIYFVHTVLKKPTDPNVPRDVIEVVVAGVMYARMGSIADVTDEFRDWIRENYKSCTKLRIGDSSDEVITMPVLLDELQSKYIGIRGGVGVVTKAFILVCLSLALEYFITLWQGDERPCTYTNCLEVIQNTTALL